MRNVMLVVLMVGLWLVATGCASIPGMSAPTETPFPTRVARVVTPSAPATTAPTLPAAVTPASTPSANTPTRGAASARTPTLPPVPIGKVTLLPDSMPPIKPMRMQSPEYGAQAFLWWRAETAHRDLTMMREAGLTWVKQTFAWRDIEGAKKGTFNWENADRAVLLANQFGIDILARVDNAPDWAAPGCFNPAKKQMGPARNMQDWLDFLDALVKRYKGRIRAYAIWNEPNLAREWCGRPPNPVEYAALLKASYAKIKSIDPNAIVVSAGLTPTSAYNDEAMPDEMFLSKMYDAMKNNSTGYFDALGLHAPGYKAPPEMSPDEVVKNPAYNNNEPVTGRVYCFRHVEDMRKIMVARGDTNKQVVILEFGWTMDPIHKEYAWFAVDESTHGQYIVRAFQWAKQNWSPWIGAMFVIYMANPDWTEQTEEYWWAITKPNGTPRGAYIRIKAMPK